MVLEDLRNGQQRLDGQSQVAEEGDIGRRAGDEGQKDMDDEEARCKIAYE